MGIHANDMLQGIITTECRGNKQITNQNNNKMITNRVEHKTVYSDCVYPDWTNRDKYRVIGKLDIDFVKDELDRLFDSDDIANKYAIQMPDGVIWYKHDFNIFAMVTV
jgi:hypothetical protein